MTIDSVKIFDVAGIGEAVKIHQLENLRAIDDMPNKIRTNEARAASNEQVHVSVRLRCLANTDRSRSA